MKKEDRERSVSRFVFFSLRISWIFLCVSYDDDDDDVWNGV